jgi:hypothetical protein
LVVSKTEPLFLKASKASYANFLSFTTSASASSKLWRSVFGEKIEGRGEGRGEGREV